MLLRSASTPILGSLLASSSCACPHFSESPSHGPGGSGKPLERTHSDTLHKLSFHHGGGPAHGPHHLSAAAFSCQFSPPPAAPEVGPPAGGGFRRVRSDGNLRDLDQQHQHPPLPMRPGARRACPVLETIPSFSFYSSRGREGSPDIVVEEGIEEGEEEEEQEEEEAGNKEGIERSVTIGESIGGEFLFPGSKVNALGNAGEESGAAPLFLARGLGLGAGDGASGLIVGFGDAAGGRDGKLPVRGGNGGDQPDMEAYYKKMVEEDPNNALFLRNYAQFLYQTKGDPRRAEEYYSRAILAEPGDGEVLSQYARLIWELHRDHNRASTYFEQAVQAAPQDSHVLAAYAAFLWDAEDEQDGGEEEAGQPRDFAGTRVSYGALASAHVR